MNAVPINSTGTVLQEHKYEASNSFYELEFSLLGRKR